jgi:hypothetical protein
VLGRESEKERTDHRPRKGVGLNGGHAFRKQEENTVQNLTLRERFADFGLALNYGLGQDLDGVDAIMAPFRRTSAERSETAPSAAALMSE